MKNYSFEDNRNRIANFSWTISENYQYHFPNDFIQDYDDIELELYEAAILGFAYKKIHMDSILSFLFSLQNKTNHFPAIKTTCFIALQEMLFSSLVKERPGLMDIQKFYALKKLKSSQKHRSKNLKEQLEYGYYSKLLNEFPLVQKQVDSLLLQLRSFQKIDSSKDFLLSFVEILKNFFELKSFQSFDQTLKETEKPLISSSDASIIKKENLPLLFKTEVNLEEEHVEAAEFARTHFFDDELELMEDEVSLKELSQAGYQQEHMRRMISSYYGMSILSDAATKRLEQLLCTDIHSNVRLHFTKGQFQQGLNDQYQMQELLYQTEQNRNHFQNNNILYRRSISKLTDIIRKTILADLSESSIKSDSGQLIAHQLWRLKKFHDHRIFKRELHNDIGTLCVDILLDSSASQFERQSIVSSQGYIIAEALSALNIPTRVMSFNNFYNFLILKIFRNYKDSAIMNSKIFEYKASGCNRDGLAIRVVRHLMEKNNMENKILIILSDGKPNDKSELLKIGNNPSLSVANYVDQIALKDTATEVFKGRLNHLSILGVFTGEEEDLEAEKQIYGKDFAHIHDISRFSDIVGFYLKEIILQNS